jgi:heterogeneous nuclear ribonucleoprotein R
VVIGMAGKVHEDKDSNENKGFAFITFTDNVAVERAIKDVQDREYIAR